MPEHILLMNPRRRRRAVRKTHRNFMPRPHWVAPHFSRSRSGRIERVSGHRANPRRRHRVRGHFMRDALLGGRRVWVRPHRSNPRRSFSRASFGGLEGLIMPTLAGAAGGIALDFAWTKLSPKLPTTFQSGWGAFAGEAVAAVAIGWGLGKVMPRQKREIMAGVVGALVIVTYQALQPMLASSLGISGLNDYTAYPTGGRVGAYMPPRASAPFALPPPSGVSGVDIVSPASAVQDAARALRGNMGPGVGGVAGYMPDTMGG